MIDFNTLETEPLLYFLLHNGVFVAGMALVFFILGLAFGAVMWRRHLRHNRQLRSEVEILNEEVIDLKRKLTEQVLTHTRFAPPAPPADVQAAPPQVTAPTPAPLQDPAPVVPPRVEPAPAPVVPAAPAVAPPVWAPKAPERPSAESSIKPDAAPAKAPPPPAPENVEKDDEMEPFSFLMDEPEEPEAAEHAAAAGSDPKGTHLDFIIASDAHAASAPAAAPPSVIPETDPALGVIFKERPADVDDLTRVQGISEALQTRLQELGVYWFQQIADWSPLQVREFSHHLAFKDRIEREHWVEQARQLAADGPDWTARLPRSRLLK